MYSSSLIGKEEEKEQGQFVQMSLGILSNGEREDKKVKIDITYYQFES